MPQPGVAFGELSRLVNRTREDQEESGLYSRNQSGHNPPIRQELLDAEGNLRAQDIGISWQDGETFLHGVRITGRRDTREEDLRPQETAEAYPSCQRDREERLPPTDDVDTVRTESGTATKVHRDVGDTGNSLCCTTSGRTAQS